MQNGPQKKAQGDPEAETNQGAPVHQAPRQVIQGMAHDLQWLGVWGNLLVGVILLFIGPFALYLFSDSKVQ